MLYRSEGEKFINLTQVKGHLSGVIPKPNNEETPQYVVQVDKRYEGHSTMNVNPVRTDWVPGVLCTPGCV